MPYADKNKQREFIRQYHKEKRIELKEKALQYKGGCCSNCGYDKCNDALEFHHTDESKKRFNISKNIFTSKRWATILEELDKCILLCSNCHRELHAKNNKESVNYR